MNKGLLILLILSLSNQVLQAQCFTSSGNPVGGTGNMGAMDKSKLRSSLFYRYSYSDRYFEGSEKYQGGNEVLQEARYNYLGFLAAYGLSDRLTVEAEAGYFMDKTQVYYLENTVLQGYGFSNLVLSLKPRIFYKPDKRFEFTCALGANIPFSTEPQALNGVTLPINIQSSTGSYGLVFQSYLVKENSFRAIRFFWVSRVEKYFENPQEYLPGTSMMNSLFFSKHLIMENWKLGDWTLILQLRNQFSNRATRSNQSIESSGHFLLYLVPQLNLSLGEHWNVSALFDLPVYRYYNGIQIANKYAFALSMIRDFSCN